MHARRHGNPVRIDEHANLLSTRWPIGDDSSRLINDRKRIVAFGVHDIRMLTKRIKHLSYVLIGT